MFLKRLSSIEPLTAEGAYQELSIDWDVDTPLYVVHEDRNGLHCTITGTSLDLENWEYGFYYLDGYCCIVEKLRKIEIYEHVG